MKEKPPKKIVMSQYLPHEPGALSQGRFGDVADGNNERANTEPTQGEVVGSDPATGESLVRIPGDRVTKVAASSAEQGSTVDFRAQQYDKIRKEGVQISSALTDYQPSSGREDGKNIDSFSTFTSVAGGTAILRDKCTPPDVKRAFLESAALQGVYLSATGKYLGVQTFNGSNYIDYVSPATNEAMQVPASLVTMMEIDRLAREAREQSKAQATLPASVAGLDTSTFISTPPQLGWECVGGNCVQTETGYFPTKELCQATCGVTSWNCVNGSCIQVQGAAGQFTTQAECVAHGCNSRYSCIGGEPTPDPNGIYPSRDSAIANGCYLGYNCDNATGVCTPAVGGEFKTLACCLTQCKPLEDVVALYHHVNIDGQIASGKDPSDLGIYNGISPTTVIQGLAPILNVGSGLVILNFKMPTPRGFPHFKFASIKLARYLYRPEVSLSPGLGVGVYSATPIKPSYSALYPSVLEALNVGIITDYLENSPTPAQNFPGAFSLWPRGQDPFYVLDNIATRQAVLNHWKFSYKAGLVSGGQGGIFSLYNTTNTMPYVETWEDFIDDPTKGYVEWVGVTYTAPVIAGLVSENVLTSDDLYSWVYPPAISNPKNTCGNDFLLYPGRLGVAVTPQITRDDSQLFAMHAPDWWLADDWFQVNFTVEPGHTLTGFELLPGTPFKRLRDHIQRGVEYMPGDLFPWEDFKATHPMLQPQNDPDLVQYKFDTMGWPACP